MDELKFLELRQQMEENNEDIKDFLRDMDSWKAEVERKKEKLATEASGAEINLPSIRNTLSKKKKKSKPKKTPPKSILKQPRIKSYDYRAWDKFDVDSALEEVDKVEVEEPSADSETDDDWEDERRLKLAEVEKEQGNIRFKEGRFDDAIEHYTTALRLAPENPLLYTNRALALIKAGRFASAESDCSTALVLDPRHVKALYRRAQARRQLEKTADAIADLRCIIDIDPKNKAALKDLHELTEDADAIVEEVAAAKAMYKLIPLSKLPPQDERRRIPINEVGRLSGPLPSTDLPKGDVGESTVRTIEAKAVSLCNSSTPEQNQRQTPGTDGKRTPAELLPIGPPSNWYQMERDLRELQQQQSCATGLAPKAVDYLCSIEPSKYAAVIGQNLDSSCLARLLMAIAQSSCLSAQDQADRLIALARLPRFDVAWMLLEDEYRTTAEQLIACLKNTLEPDRHAGLLKSYA
ncbi:RNA polymerase II-associated protein 3 [Sparganum proliferum]